MTTRLLVLGCCTALALAACGDDDDDAAVNAGGSHRDAAPSQRDAGPMHDAGRMADAAAMEDAGGSGSDPCAVIPDTAMGVLEAYGAAWSESDAEARDCLLQQSLIEDAVYEDPMGHGEGRAALSDTIANTLTTLPMANILLVGDPDLRMDEGRFAWSFRNGETQLIPGEDFAEFAEDGRIAHITGYFGPFDADAPDGALADLQTAWNSTDADERETLLASAFADGALLTMDGAQAEGPEMIATILDGELNVVSVHSYGMPARQRAVVELDGETYIAYARLDADDKIERLALFEGELGSM
jgi:hypothetical protein